MITKGSFPSLAVPSHELRLRLGTTELSSEMQQWIQQTQNAANCRYCYTRLPVEIPQDGTVRIGDWSIPSVSLCKNLSGCREAFLFVVTIGTEIDRLIARLAVASPAQQFVTDAAASALAEGGADAVSALLGDHRSCRPRFSPGFGDFTLAYQPELLRLTDAGRQIGVTVTDTLFLTPTKSVTAIMGVQA